MARRKGESDEDYLARVLRNARAPHSGRNTHFGRPASGVEPSRKAILLTLLAIAALIVVVPVVLFVLGPSGPLR